MVVERREVMQATQAQQWKQDMHDLELKAATWCQDQVQSVHREKEQAVAAVQTKCDAWLVATLASQCASVVCVTLSCKTVLVDALACICCRHVPLLVLIIACTDDSH